MVAYLHDYTVLLPFYFLLQTLMSAQCVMVAAPTFVTIALAATTAHVQQGTAFLPTAIHAKVCMPAGVSAKLLNVHVACT